MRNTLVLTIVTLAVTFFVLNTGTDAAMRKCQEQHSFGTCFQALHR